MVITLVNQNVMSKFQDFTLCGHTKLRDSTYIRPHPLNFLQQSTSQLACCHVHVAKPVVHRRPCYMVLPMQSEEWPVCTLVFNYIHTTHSKW